MNLLKADFGDWHIQYLPDDGARIEILRYAGYDLLVPVPYLFKTPAEFCGEYENRPVYGYDDCFPTVDPCIYPGTNLRCRDHGELCWRSWHTEVIENSLICSTDCPGPAVSFRRMLRFDRNQLTWRFEVKCKMHEECVFLHLMHALLPPGEIRSIDLPLFTNAIDEVSGQSSGLNNPSDLSHFLFALGEGSYSMLLLREISDGFVGLQFNNGLHLKIHFDKKLFPTLGIWWNNRGYPQGGELRSECAFEPIPGTCSDLSKSFRDGVYLSVKPGEKFCWEVIWRII